MGWHREGETMKTIIVIETAEELVSFANPNRVEGDKDPFLGPNPKLIFENDYHYIRLEADGFELSQGVRVEDVLKELAKEANFDIHIT